MKFHNEDFVDRQAGVDAFTNFWRSLATEVPSAEFIADPSAGEVDIESFNLYDTPAMDFKARAMVCKLQGVVGGGVPADRDINSTVIGKTDTTLTVKLAAWDATIANNAPLQPSDDFDATRKLEQDISGCTNRFAQSTKILNLPDGYTFSTMGELSQMFPDVRDIWNAAKSDPIGSIRTSYVWNYCFEENYFHNYQFKDCISLTYNTLADAQAGTNMVEGEMSFRIIAEDGDNFGAKTAQRSWDFFTLGLLRWPPGYECTCKYL